jgi:hypothetical protein
VVQSETDTRSKRGFFLISRQTVVSADHSINDVAMKTADRLLEAVEHGPAGLGLRLHVDLNLLDREEYSPFISMRTLQISH